MWRLTGFLFCASPFINPPLDHSLSALSCPRCDGDESVCSSRAAGGDYGDPADRSEGPGTGTQIAAAASPPSALASAESPVTMPLATALGCLILPRPPRTSCAPPGTGWRRRPAEGPCCTWTGIGWRPRQERPLLSHILPSHSLPDPFNLS